MMNIAMISDMAMLIRDTWNQRVLKRPRDYFFITIVEMTVAALLLLPFMTRAAYGYGWWSWDVSSDVCHVSSCSSSSQAWGHEVRLFTQGRSVGGETPLRIELLDDPTGDRHDDHLATFVLRTLLINSDEMTFGDDNYAWSDEYVAVTMIGDSGEPFTMRFYWGDYSFRSNGPPFGFMNDI